MIQDVQMLEQSSYLTFQQLHFHLSFYGLVLLEASKVKLNFSQVNNSMN